MGIPFLLVAPTGIAAKRMSTITGSDAATIHRAFGARGFTRSDQERKATYVGVVGESTRKDTRHSGGEEWEYGPGNPHPARMVILDEASMLDLHMLYRLLTATRSTCQIVFVGDPFQLPSVGPGDVLRDLVRAKVFPHSHLTQIWRQEGTSGIVIAAHEVHAGRTPTSDGKDFVLLPAPDEEEASDLIVAIARKLYDKKANFQVLSPRHAGDAGVTTLNHRLRLALNPASSGVVEMRLGGSVVREGDRIMVVKNDYNMGVYNGDVGKVARIDRRAKEIEVKIFEGLGLPSRLIRYRFSDASRALRLAYAQTVHKSQGQEYDVIVLPVLSSFGRQLQRNLFYTAITRAKKKVLVVGSASAIARAVSNNRAEKRNTLLAERLIDRLGKGGAVAAGAVT
jgi:exodeoxyribonuclease V alpha subunit